MTEKNVMFKLNIVLIIGKIESLPWEIYVFVIWGVPSRMEN